MQSDLIFYICDRFFQKLGIFSVHELFHIFYICFVVHFWSTSGDHFSFPLWAGIYYLMWRHSCLHNQHSWILRLSTSFGVLKIPTLAHINGFLKSVSCNNFSPEVLQDIPQTILTRIKLSHSYVTY